MKRLLPLFVMTLTLLTTIPSGAVEGKAGTEKFYGKITKVDMERKVLTVYNKKRDTASDFSWDQGTNFVHQKKPIHPSELKIGQSLIVSYVADNEVNKATRITVRQASSFKKKTARSTVE